MVGDTSGQLRLCWQHMWRWSGGDQVVLHPALNMAWWGLLCCACALLLPHGLSEYMPTCNFLYCQSRVIAAPYTIWKEAQQNPDIDPGESCMCTSCLYQLAGCVAWCPHSVLRDMTGDKYSHWSF
jgi:hypothetical protein